jgi:hypothetical protein
VCGAALIGRRIDARFCGPACRLKRHRSAKRRAALGDMWRQVEAAHRRPRFTVDAGADVHDFAAVADLGAETRSAVAAVAVAHGIRPGGARRWHYADVKVVRHFTRKVFDHLNPEHEGELPALDDYVYLADEWRKYAHTGEPSWFDAFDDAADE